MVSCNGATLATAGTAIAVALANGLSTDETNILGALFTVIGDQLSLIAATEAAGDSDSKGKTADTELAADSGKENTAGTALLSDAGSGGENTAGKAFFPDTGPGKKNTAGKAHLPDTVRKF